MSRPVYTTFPKTEALPVLHSVFPAGRRKEKYGRQGNGTGTSTGGGWRDTKAVVICCQKGEGGEGGEEASNEITGSGASDGGGERWAAHH